MSGPASLLLRRPSVLRLLCSASDQLCISFVLPALSSAGSLGHQRPMLRFCSFRRFIPHFLCSPSTESCVLHVLLFRQRPLVLFLCSVSTQLGISLGTTESSLAFSFISESRFSSTMFFSTQFCLFVLSSVPFCVFFVSPALVLAFFFIPKSHSASAPSLASSFSPVSEPSSSLLRQHPILRLFVPPATHPAFPVFCQH